MVVVVMVVMVVVVMVVMVVMVFMVLMEVVGVGGVSGVGCSVGGFVCGVGGDGAGDGGSDCGSRGFVMQWGCCFGGGAAVVMGLDCITMIINKSMFQMMSTMLTNKYPSNKLMSKHAEQFGCGSLLLEVLPHKYSLTPGWVGVIWIHVQN